jgi:hypothetical protein
VATTEGIRVIFRALTARSPVALESSFPDPFPTELEGAGCLKGKNRERMSVSLVDSTRDYPLIVKNDLS